MSSSSFFSKRWTRLVAALLVVTAVADSAFAQGGGIGPGTIARGNGGQQSASQKSKVP
ncbi:MAG: hypothetical protein HZA52_14125 [Planctomycetes bacterium]|nr:hypothetical protein [Planctomycetota bacterium]